ncbi:MAG: hypothetical protein AAGG68_28165 [Bacteroidota bacterium]
MTNRSINVKVEKVNSGTVTIKLMSVNRKMPVKKDKFLEEVENGTYNVLNPQMLEEIRE